MRNADGKVAIITGASRGIGRAIAERLAQDGIRVVVNYGTSAAEAASVVDGVTSHGSRAIAIQPRSAAFWTLWRDHPVLPQRFGSAGAWQEILRRLEGGNPSGSDFRNSVDFIRRYDRGNEE